MNTSKSPDEKTRLGVGGEESAGDCLEDPRVHLAAERTLLAWIRTGLAMMGFGFVVARSGHFFQQLLEMRDAAAAAPHKGLSFWIGGGLILLGTVALVLAGLEHWRFIRTQPHLRSIGKMRLIMGIGAAVALGLLGLVMIGYLAAL